MDPGEGPLQQLAFALRKLRTEAGSPTYREMAARTGSGASTLAQAASGERLPSLPTLVAYVQACGGDVAQWEERWREVAQAAAARLRPDEDSIVLPYRGLARFEPDDQDLFFGRAALVAQLVDAVRAHRVVAAVGASGSGKSSLLRAGLVPALRTGRSHAQRPSAMRIFTPGPRPFTTHAALFQPAPGAGETVVLIDQFEELFTLGADGTERDSFLDLLLTACAPDSRLRVVIAVRADFFGRCAEHAGLTAALRHSTVLVGTMSPAELREAVVRPAAAAGLIVARDLTEKVVEDTVGEPGGLPLMSHALLETWRRRRGRALTLEMYQAAGGLDGAIAKTAEDVHAGLTPQQADLARSILLRLVAPGDGTPDTRRPTSRSELDGLADPGHSTVVIERLAGARLLTLDDDTVHLAHEALITGWPRLRGWLEENRERLRVHRKLTEAAWAWAELGEDSGALYRGTRLTTAEETFATGERHHLTAEERSFLAASVALRRQEQQVATRGKRRLRRLRTSLSAVAVLALVAALLAWQQDRSQERERVQAQARRIAALADSLRATDPATAMQLSLASWSLAHLPETRAALVSAVAQREQDALTDPDTDPTTKRYLTGNGRTLVSVGARRVAQWDVRTHHRTAVHQGLHDLQVNRPGAISPDARQLIVTEKGQTRLWDLRTGRAVGPQLPAETGAEFSPSGRTLVLYRTQGPDDVVQLRDPTGRHVLLERRMRASTYRKDGTGGPTPEVWSLQRLMLQRPRAPYPTPDAAVSADGRLMALCVPGTRLELWDVTRRRRLPAPWAPTAQGVNCLMKDFQFTPDSRTLVLRSDSQVRRWDVASGRPLPTITHPGLREIAFSSDGRFLAASTAGEILVWRVSMPGRPVFRHALADESVSELRVDLHRRQIHYLAGRSGTVVRTLSLDNVFDPSWHPQSAVTAAFAPDGSTLATAYHDTDTGPLRITLTDPRTGRHLADPPAATCPRHRADASLPPLPCTGLMAFSPDSDTLAYAGTDAFTIDGSKAAVHVSLWDIPAHHTKTSFALAQPADPRGTNQVNGITFNHDGTALMVSRFPKEETIRTWDLHRRTLTKEVAGVGGEILALTPDGRLLVTSHGHIVDLPSGKVSRHTLSQDLTTALALSPDGKYLAAGDLSGRVTLWNTRADHLLGVMSPHPAPPLPTDNPSTTEPDEASPVQITALAFSPDSRTLATADHSGALRLWDTTSSQPVGSALPTSGAGLLALAFSPDNTTLYAAGDHVPLHRHTIAPQRLAATVCQRAGSLSRTSWQAYIPQVPYRSVC